MNAGTAGLVIGGIGALPLGGVALGTFRRAGPLEARFGQGLQELSPSPTGTVVDEPPAPTEAEAALPQSTPLPQRSSAARLGLSVAGAVLALIVGGALLYVLGRWASVLVGLAGPGAKWIARSVVVGDTKGWGSEAKQWRLTSVDVGTMPAGRWRLTLSPAGTPPSCGPGSAWTCPASRDGSSSPPGR